MIIIIIIIIIILLTGYKFQFSLVFTIIPNKMKLHQLALAFFVCFSSQNQYVHSKDAHQTDEKNYTDGIGYIIPHHRGTADEAAQNFHNNVSFYDHSTVLHVVFKSDYHTMICMYK